jgi:hypothetical protein
MRLTLVTLVKRSGKPYGKELVKGKLPEVIVWPPATHEGGAAFVRLDGTNVYRQALTIQANILHDKSWSPKELNSYKVCAGMEISIRGRR